jgi:hypothetical protein
VIYEFDMTEEEKIQKRKKEQCFVSAKKNNDKACSNNYSADLVVILITISEKNR